MSVEYGADSVKILRILYMYTMWKVKDKECKELVTEIFPTN